MRRWLKLALAFIVLAALVAAAQLYFNMPVLIRYGEWQAQPSAAIVISFALVLLALLAIVVKVAALILFLPSRIASWRQHKNEQRRIKVHIDTLRNLILGDVRAAQKGFARLANDHNESAAVYAAHAARLTDGENDKSAFLRRAAAASADGDNAAVVILSKAQLAYHQGQATEALALLAQNDKNAAPEMLRLLYQIRVERQDSAGALTALYRLRDIAPAAQLDDSVCEVISNHFATCDNANEVNVFWRDSLRDGERKNTTLAASRARALHRLGDPKNAAAILTKILKQSGAQAEVFFAVVAIGDAPLCETAFTIGQTRADMEDGKALLPAMAELAARLGYWGKARRYYQMANAAEPGKYARDIAKLPADDNASATSANSAADAKTPVAGV